MLNNLGDKTQTRLLVFSEDYKCVLLRLVEDENPYNSHWTIPFEENFFSKTGVATVANTAKKVSIKVGPGGLHVYAGMITNQALETELTIKDNTVYAMCQISGFSTLKLEEGVDWLVPLCAYLTGPEGGLQKRQMLMVDLSPAN